MIELACKPKFNTNLKIIEEADYAFIYTQNAIKLLNSTALRIIKLCNGKLTVHEIIEKICSTFPDYPREKIRQDVLEFLEKCVKIGVVLL